MGWHNGNYDTCSCDECTNRREQPCEDVAMCRRCDDILEDDGSCLACSESATRTPISELVGKTIVGSEYVDGGAWFEIRIRTADGLTITSGGYKSEASAALTRGADTLTSWAF